MAHLYIIINISLHIINSMAHLYIIINISLHIINSNISRRIQEYKYKKHQNNLNKVLNPGITSQINLLNFFSCLVYKNTIPRLQPIAILLLETSKHVY